MRFKSIFLYDLVSNLITSNNLISTKGQKLGEVSNNMANNGSKMSPPPQNTRKGSMVKMHKFLWAFLHFGHVFGP